LCTRRALRGRDRVRAPCPFYLRPPSDTCTACVSRDRPRRDTPSQDGASRRVVPGIVRRRCSKGGNDNRDPRRAPDFAQPVHAWRAWYVVKGFETLITPRNGSFFQANRSFETPHRPRGPLEHAGMQGKLRGVRDSRPLGAGMDSSPYFSQTREVLPQRGHHLRR
jgi:hypothetical protein